jgi:chemotaxis protein MotB
MVKFLKTLTLGTMAFIVAAGCSGQKIDTLKDAVCCDGGFEYRHPTAWEKEQQRLKDELAAAQKQLADRDREIASLRSGTSDSLRSAQTDLDRAKSHSAELERQLADRDRELASLRSGAGDSSRLASQLSSTQGENARLASELAASQASLAAVHAGAGDKDKFASELNAARQRNAELETQLAAAQGNLADRDRELAGLRGDLSAEMTKLKEAQRGLIRALRPQIENKNIAVDLDNERLLINLASSYLFGSGEDQLKPAGADALKQVGTILKDFPEYKVAVDGHTDNRAIRGELKKKFPTNKELSEARAANAAMALGEGGLSAVTTHGYADSQPIMPNTTDAGRAKNRRVEVRVTK